MAIRRGVLEGSSGSHRVRREIQMGLEVKKKGPGGSNERFRATQVTGSGKRSVGPR